MSEALEESQSLLDNTLNIFAFLPVAESNPAFLVRTKTNLEHDTEQLLESDKKRRKHGAQTTVFVEGSQATYAHVISTGHNLLLFLLTLSPTARNSFLFKSIDSLLTAYSTPHFKQWASRQAVTRPDINHCIIATYQEILAMYCTVAHTSTYHAHLKANTPFPEQAHKAILNAQHDLVL